MRPLALLLTLGAACAQLEAPTQPCQTANDCRAPLVCCTGGYYLTLNDLTGPTCSVRAECPGDYLPFLPAGAPCGRAPEIEGESCKAGLSCCPSTLSCLDDASCTAQPAPSEADPSATVACQADGDCPSGSVCCGITFSDREGVCRSVPSCAREQALAPPSG